MAAAGLLLVPRGVEHFDFDLVPAGETELEGASAAVGELGRFFVVLSEQVADDFLELGGVVDLGHEVHFDLGSIPSQEAGAVG